MLDCIKNIIGIKHCSYKRSYLKDISQQAGITNNALDSLASDDQIHFLNVLEDVKSRGIDRLIGMLTEKGIVLRSEGNDLCFGDINTNILVPTQSTGIDNGILLTLQNSKYVTIKLTRMIFYSQTQQTVVFFIKDLIFNTILLSLSVNLEIGANEIILDYELNPRLVSSNILIGYNQNLVDYYKTLDKNCKYYDCGGCVNSCQTSLITTQSYPQNTSNTYGITLYYSLICSLEKLICDNASIFALPLLYTTSIEFIYERLGSERLNNITLLRNEQYDRLLLDYEKSLERSLQGIMQNFNFYDNCCFECKELNYTSYFNI